MRAAVVVGPPYYYYGYYGPSFWGWGGYGPWGYPWGYPPYWQVHYYDTTGDARLQVKPRETQVFVDGYYVGVADDYDGSLQRLRVEAGEHELEFYLEGHKTVRQKVLFRREGTLKITRVMEPLGPGETSDRPTPIAPPPDRPAARQDPGDDPRNAGGQMPPQVRGGDSDAYGTLSIRVQPEDAEVYIDGERWDGTAGSRLNVELPDGPHRIEIRKEGFRSYTANVRIQRGRTETVNVRLSQ